MTIRIRCPRCSHESAYADEHECTAQECQTCDARLELPALVRYACPSCAHRYVTGPQHIGRSFACRTCQTKITVPKKSAPGSEKGGADSTGDHWFAGDPADATPKLGPADADAALAGDGHPGLWIAGSVLCALTALVIIPLPTAAAGAFCGLRAKRLYHPRGQALIIANIVAGLLGALLGIYLRFNY